jgi:hypothetical protein
MLLETKDLPPKLRELVEAFARENMELIDPNVSYGACVNITHKFYRFLKEAGYPERTMGLEGFRASWWWKGAKVDYLNFGEPFTDDAGVETPHNFYHNNGHNGHLCAWIAEEIGSDVGFFIDFTATQYLNGAPFPLIWKG